MTNDLPQRAIITLQRADNSIIGDPIIREIAGDVTFASLFEEYTELVANPDDEIESFQILGA